MKGSFGSDNFSGALPAVLKALEEASRGHRHSYGDDDLTAAAVSEFKRIFGADIEVFFVYNGTGANVLGISAFADSYHAIICPETAHVNTDECGAVEKHTGCKLLTVPTPAGKLAPADIRARALGFGNQHHVQPRIVSVSQCTELGTAYSADELGAICETAHSLGMFVHVDGARIANALAYAGVAPAAMTREAGVDVLSFGGTKNGMLFGEAVIFFRRPPKEPRYIRKQMMQLHSKSRFIAAQFLAVLRDDLWLKSAGHANSMARRLADAVASIPGARITRQVQGNEVFAILPADVIAPLQEECFFYVWDETASEVRWVCSFDTDEEDIEEFAGKLREKLRIKN
ncbi:MAG: low specificity L-threonine aldolase [Prevotellaceae bacterium]|jgi:threonine aldolase|nr:low specificity L-threonine aldolase [Prevotellaceae bacterium]